MPLAIEQIFLTGRFHATRWNQSPFEDLHGEWPPSPWRLLRTLAARWFEYARETGDLETAVRDRLLRALARELPTFHLPTNAIHSSAWASRGLKQYQPTELTKSDKKKGEPWVKRPQTTLAVDSFACVPHSAPVIWLWPTLDLGQDKAAIELLDHLLRRVTYFGRAESLSFLRRLPDDAALPAPNCTLLSEPGAGSPVLALTPGQSLDINVLLAHSDDQLVRFRRIPPGTAWRFARLPVPAVVKVEQPKPQRAPVSLMQFALGSRVFPPMASWIRLTERFRGAALDALARQLAAKPKTRFRDLSPSQRAGFALMTGKGADERPLTGHRHTWFLLLPDAGGRPTRLVCYRHEPFTAQEQDALLAASEMPLSWDYGSNDWRFRAVPLPGETPLPKDIFGRALEWESSTPYIPSRHVFARNGKPKPGLGVAQQVAADLANAGLPAAKVFLANEELERRGIWVKIHRPRRVRDGATNDLKRGYRVRILFSAPVDGPIALGHSTHFGLGLFVPVGEEKQ